MIIWRFFEIFWFLTQSKFDWPICKSKTEPVHTSGAPKLKVCYFLGVVFGKIVGVLFSWLEKVVEVTLELINL